LQNATYRRPGWIGELLSALPEQDPYNRELWISFYKMHNEVILSYFSTRPDDLLVLNVSEPNAYGEFCSFLGIPPRDPQASFPWENRTRNQSLEELKATDRQLTN
jgi:hypothetical protein